MLGAASPEAVSQAAREQSSQLLLAPNFGLVSGHAAGQSGTSLRLRLLTNITDPNAGLNVSRSFAATLSLTLLAAPDPGQSFGLRFSDGGIDAANNDVVELVWAGVAGNGVILLRKQDFAAGTITDLASAPVAAPLGAAMLVLSLSHGAPGSQLIYGSYGYADNNGLLLGGITTFGTPATAFNGEAYTRVELRATGVSAPIPEPGSWALMAAGLAGLALRRRMRGAA